MSDRSPWLTRRIPRPDAGLRLYCFPYAGGSASEFLHWSDRLPAIEVWGVVPPGRGERLGEPPFTRVADLVGAFVTETELRAPFAFFGHSVGALMAYETARALHGRGWRSPEWLFVSGHRPPHLPLIDVPIHQLPDREFRAIVEHRYPAPPPELAEDPELYAELLETLRGDLAVFESYRHVPGDPLPCPITVICGVDDHWAEADLAPWSGHTSAECRIRMIPGDHFYLPEHGDDVIRVLAEALSLGRTR